MDAAYDEDLSQNPFFMDFQNEHLELLEQCITHGWIICVPRVGTVLSQVFTLQDYLGHILVCNEELPTTHFMTLTEKSLRVINKVIFIDQNDVGLPFEIHILFEETFYTIDKMKYKVWCIECPLQLEVQLKDNNISQCPTLLNLKDCIDFLWTESSGKDVLENMDTVIVTFKTRFKNMKISLNNLKDELSVLYTNCLQMALKNRRLKERSCISKNMMDNVKLAVETYMHHGIYKESFEVLSVCTAYEDSNLNKIIRNLSDIQLRDLDVSNEFNQCIPSARRNLSLLQSYSTILGKVGCIKSTISSINKPSNKDSHIFATTDELLPIFIFLVVKSGVSNWIAHLYFLKYFRFSVHSYFESDEISFCISTLEAVIEQIKCGVFKNSCPCSESQCFLGYDNEYSCKENQHDSKLCSESSNANDLQYLYHQVKLSNFEKVKEILMQNKDIKENIQDSLESSSSGLDLKKVCLEEVLNDNSVEVSLKLCHPLCSCSKCSRAFSKNLLRTSPTVFSCDKHGFTVLHIASIYGKPNIVSLVLEMGANVNSIDLNGSTPLHYAASKGHQSIVLMLLQAGADFNLLNMDKNSALHLACNNGHDCCVKALVYLSEQSKHSISIDCQNNNGDTPLHLASKWGYELILRILLEYNADPWITNKKGKTAVDLAHSKLMTKLLLTGVPNMLEYVNININPKQNNSECVNDVNTALPLLDLNDDNTLHLKLNLNNMAYRVNSIKPNSTKGIHHIERVFNAIKHGDVKLACFYMNIDENNQSNPFQLNQEAASTIKQCHPLCVCKNCKALKTVERGEEKNSFDINTCDSQGNTPLHMAVKHNILELCEVLLNNGAKSNVKNNFGSTPLHIACQEKRIEIVKLLLKYFRNLKSKDSMGNTPFHLACIAGSIEIVKIFIEFQPYESISNFSQKTPLDEAKDRLHLTIIALIEDSLRYRNNS